MGGGGRIAEIARDRKSKTPETHAKLGYLGMPWDEPEGEGSARSGDRCNREIGLATNRNTAEGTLPQRANTGLVGDPGAVPHEHGEVGDRKGNGMRCFHRRRCAIP